MERNLTQYDLVHFPLYLKSAILTFVHVNSVLHNCLVNYKISFSGLVLLRKHRTISCLIGI